MELNEEENNFQVYIRIRPLKVDQLGDGLRARSPNKRSYHIERGASPRLLNENMP